MPGPNFPRARPTRPAIDLAKFPVYRKTQLGQETWIAKVLPDGVLDPVERFTWERWKKLTGENK